MSRQGIPISINDIKKTQDKFVDKPVFIVINDLYNLLSEDVDFTEIREIKNFINNLIKNGDKANIHLVIFTSSLSKNIISQELLDNINVKIVLGEFNEKISNSVFGKDIAFKAMPNIKGRNFVSKNGEELEAQIYKFDNEDPKYLEQTLFERLSKNHGIETQNNYQEENNYQKVNDKLPKRKLYRDDFMNKSGKIDYNKILEM